MLHPSLKSMIDRLREENNPVLGEVLDILERWPRLRYEERPDGLWTLWDHKEKMSRWIDNTGQMSKIYDIEDRVLNRPKKVYPNDTIF
jgi:hypothetical protein